MNNTTKMLLPVTALCIYCSGCVAYEQPVYRRTPTYVAPATTTYVTPATTTYVTEPAYVAPVTYSTTTYYSEPRYISTGGYRHHAVGRLPLHGKYGSGPRHHDNNPRISPRHNPAHGPHISNSPQHAASKAAAQNAKTARKAGAAQQHAIRKAGTRTLKP